MRSLHVGSARRRSKLSDRRAWARVDLVKHRPLRGRCFTELAPEGRSVELPSDLVVREVGRDGGWGEGLGPEAGVMGPGGVEPPTSRLSGVRSNQAELRAPKKTGARPFRTEGGSGAGRTPSYGCGAAGSSFLGPGIPLVGLSSPAGCHSRSQSTVATQRSTMTRLGDRGAWARVEWMKQRPLAGPMLHRARAQRGARLNHRPHAYQACALTRLSYGPRRRPARDRSVLREGRAPGGLHPMDTGRGVQVSWAPGVPFSTM